MEVSLSWWCFFQPFPSPYSRIISSLDLHWPWVFYWLVFVSPPDAVSTGAILKFVKIPKSTSAVLEGESLLNDASSLIIFKFALLAVGTGQFIFRDAFIDFSWMVVGGIAVGLF